MAEPWKIAFGRYLRILRDRCDYSLDDVCSLSQTFPDPISKSYLSRCENGIQRLAFSKMIPLSRIYDVPSEVLAERMELDMELDRVGGPETAGMSYRELFDAGQVAVVEGYPWTAYGLFRDSVVRAIVDPVEPRHRSLTEQFAMSLMNCATATRKLGRYRYSIHEYQHLQTFGEIDSRQRALLLLLSSQCYRNLGEYGLARDNAEQAIRVAESTGDSLAIGHALTARGLLSSVENDPEMAQIVYQRAFELFREAGDEPDCARVLTNLAQAYFDARRYRAARKSLLAARRLGQANGQHRTLALSCILLGEIEAVEQRNGNATRYWEEAVLLARKLDDKIIRFKAEFFLYRQATLEGNDRAVRVRYRRLKRLSAWIPASTWELGEFRRTAS